jgi:hypothetical protein
MKKQRECAAQHELHIKLSPIRAVMLDQKRPEIQKYHSPLFLLNQTAKTV